MAIKRKFDSDSVESSVRCAKQLRLVPFPAYEPEPDTDVTMSDASDSPAESASFDQHHLRLDSNSSTTSTESGNSSNFAYPSFNIYPNPFFGPDGLVDTNSHTFSRYSTPPPTQKPVGLFEPQNASAHHKQNCTQIPRLRVACAPGLNGQRSMWTQCMECGAIEMLDPDY
ncbi:hypothetical protein BV25DRAFT_1824868 [Artomyces pyxidatus]|uniref:Uncharacterized protein n=1 Tax=Artomyces pyxidatus TaxID=48021 RepID=A0ACB8T366_9AGAM|nr:hypothetical protein BV25DRAFT_1824868 [Artomyces pyxidatus]